MNSTWRDLSRFARPTLVVVVAQVLWGSTLVWAATPPKAKSPFPFADPQDFFNRFFGQETPADKQALARIQITPQEEQRLGNQAAQAYLAELKRRKIRVISRGQDVEYLKRLVELIQPSMRNAKRYRSIKIYLAESRQTDARSFPGGTLVFTRGILDFARNEAALVGVVGHELSHLDHGHQLIHLRQMKLARQTFSGAGKASDPRRMMSSGMLLMRMFARPFRPEDEAQADRDGATWAYQAGYDPREMGELFLRFHKRDKNQRQSMPAFLRTHPFHVDRYRAIQQIYKKLHHQTPNKKLYIGKRNLQQRVTRAEREFKE